MLKCRIRRNGTELTSADLLNGDGSRSVEAAAKWRGVGLECHCCAQPVILKAGAVKMPYFAHRAKGAPCPYVREMGGESEEHRLGKVLLYRHFRQLFPSARVSLEYAHSGRYADVLVEQEGRRLAIEYQRSRLKHSELRQRTFDANSHGIPVRWIVSTAGRRC